MNTTDLPAQILNLSCQPPAWHYGVSYRQGHEDARHAAAELALPLQQRVEALEAFIEQMRQSLVAHNCSTMDCLCTAACHVQDEVDETRELPASAYDRMQAALNEGR